MYKSKKELQEDAKKILADIWVAGNVSNLTPNWKDLPHNYFATKLYELEEIIYKYAPLPESIQEALDSGDGVYRP